MAVVVALATFPPLSLTKQGPRPVKERALARSPQRREEHAGGRISEKKKKSASSTSSGRKSLS